MIKGDKIKLVKEMGAFKNVGEICEVVDVAEGGVISFRFGRYHLGCMSYDEFLKYFEVVDNNAWTDWKKTTVTIRNIDGELERIVLEHRNNHKKTQVRYNGLKAESTCHSIDVFDAEKGLKLAIKRLHVKYLDRQVKQLAKKM